jgi:hypothetical protein
MVEHRQSLMDYGDLDSLYLHDDAVASLERVSRPTDHAED